MISFLSMNMNPGVLVGSAGTEMEVHFFISAIRELSPQLCTRWLQLHTKTAG